MRVHTRHTRRRGARLRDLTRQQLGSTLSLSVGTHADLTVLEVGDRSRVGGSRMLSSACGVPKRGEVRKIRRSVGEAEAWTLASTGRVEDEESGFFVTGSLADAESSAAAPTEQASTEAVHAPEAAQPDPEELAMQADVSEEPTPQSSAEPSAASLLEVGPTAPLSRFPHPPQVKPRWSQR